MGRRRQWPSGTRPRPRWGRTSGRRPCPTCCSASRPRPDRGNARQKSGKPACAGKARCAGFPVGDEVELVSRGGRPMTRYFPELPLAFRGLREAKVVLDGELVVVVKGGLDFGALQQRIHPTDSRVRMLSLQTPARYVVFVVLAIGADDLRATPLGDRRKRLEQ